MRVLVIEDDQETASFLRRALKEQGHVAEYAGDGQTGLELARANAYDVLIVDRMLPKRDGLAVIGALRAEEIRTPALILSALGEVDDRGHVGHSLVERRKVVHVHDRPGVERGITRGFLGHDVLAPARRTERPRIEVGLPARCAPLDQQPVVACSLPVLTRVVVGRRDVEAHAFAGLTSTAARPSRAPTPWPRRLG